MSYFLVFDFRIIHHLRQKVSWISPPAPVFSKTVNISGGKMYRPTTASVLGARSGEGFSTSFIILSSAKTTKP